MSISDYPYLIVFLIAPILLAKAGPIRILAHLVLSQLIVFLASASPVAYGITILMGIIPFVYKQFFTKRSPILIVMTVSLLYFNQFEWLLNPLNIRTLSFRLMGYSYMVFRQIDYLFTDEQDPISFIDYLSYVFSFYTLIAGPIDRYQRFIVNLYHPSESLKQADIINSMHRVVNGYFKVIVVSTVLKQQADSFFESSLILFALTNLAYIYFNFSGYCDVVIGFARIANLELPENFNKPYRARNINEFWKRQHITLTSWITDYIFTPMVLWLNTKNLSINQSQMIGFFVTFSIAGLWHGSTMDYLVYGLLQGMGVCLTKMYLDTLRHHFKTQKRINVFRHKKWVVLSEWLTTQVYIAGSFMFLGYPLLERILHL